MKLRLTDQFARNAPLPTEHQIIHWDTNIKGFGLRLTRGGSRGFILNYRISGRERRFTIGAFPEWSCAQARESAKALRRGVDSGRDPQRERREEHAAPSLADLWEKYNEDYLPLRSLATQIADRSLWKVVAPKLGKIKLASLSPADIDKFHRYVTESRETPARANRCVELVRRLFNAGKRWEWCNSDNPCTGYRRNPERPRQRFLSASEIGSLMAALDAHPERISAAAIKFLLFTGARRGEVLNMRWQDLDLANGVWNKPPSATKQKREHRVVLSPQAMEIIAEMKKVSTHGYVFPGKVEGRSLTDIKRTWKSACKAAGIIGVRLHDLRHSFASVLVSAGVTLPQIGQLLGHSQASTTNRYSHLYDSVQRQAVELAGRIIVGGGE